MESWLGEARGRQVVEESFGGGGGTHLVQDLVVVGLCDANKLTVVHFRLHHSLVIQLLHRRSDSKTKKKLNNKTRASLK